MRCGAVKRLIAFTLFALVLLACPLHAAAAWYDGIYLWSGLAVVISAAFLGLAYMAARLFELQMLDAWVKVELSELVTSLLIAVFCVSMIAIVNNASQFLTGDTGATDITAVAQGFLRNGVYADGQALYMKLAEAYFHVSRVASFAYTAGASIAVASISYSSAPGSGISPLLSELGQGMDTVSNFMLLAASQSAFLDFFRNAAVVMLPVGIFLRCFSLTRKVGGVVLAAVIAAAVIYPASFMLSREIYAYYRTGGVVPPAAPKATSLVGQTSLINVAASSNPPAANLICSPYMQRFVQSPLPFLGGEMGWWIVICVPICLLTIGGFGACMGTCGKVIFTMFYIIKSSFPIIIYLSVLMPFANQIGSTSALIAGYYEPLASHALPAVAQYTVLSLVVFFIPLIIAMSTLRNFAIMFGGEPQLYGLSKLV
ncbi:Uncharacterised protein [uncultured archaeon]|nr:Uncharacterised protein [uncultured archaeon]